MGSHLPPGRSSQERPITQQGQERQRQRQTTGRSVIQPAPPSLPETVHVWSIGRRQKVAILVSVVLLIILGWFGGMYSASSSYNIVLTIVLLGIAEAIPLFSGAVFGPWVGLFTAGLGLFIGGYVLTYVDGTSRGYTSSYINSYISSAWPLALAAAAIGFTAGLAVLITKGRYNGPRAIALAEGFSALGIVVVVIVVALIADHGYSSYVIRDILQAVLYTLPGLVLLPILLFVYDKIIHRQNA
jgi:energy-coupling factor transport system substrate-specific component